MYKFLFLFLTFLFLYTQLLSQKKYDLYSINNKTISPSLKNIIKELCQQKDLTIPLNCSEFEKEDFLVKGNKAFILSFYSSLSKIALAQNNYKVLAPIFIKVIEIWNNEHLIIRSSKLLFAILPIAELYNDYESLSNIHMQFAHNYAISYQRDIALEHAKKALIMANKSNIKSLKIKVLLLLAKLHFQDNYNKIQGEQYLQNALEISAITNDIYLKNDCRILLARSKLYTDINATIAIADTLNTNYRNIFDERKIDIELLNADIALVKQDFEKSKNIILKILPTIEEFSLVEKETNALKILLEVQANIWQDYRINYYINLLDKKINTATQQFNIIVLNELENTYKTEYQANIIQAQELQLERSNLRNTIYALLAFLSITFIILLIRLLKRKQSNFKLQQANELLQLQQSIHSLELNNYNKQLDPHEIKNIIASIAPELQKKAPSVYKKMIKLFNITRASLNNGIFEDLNSQLQQVGDLLSLHQTLFANNINYYMENSSHNNTNLPRLILKNIVESIIKNEIELHVNPKDINILIQENNGYSHIYINVSIDLANSTYLEFNSNNSIINTYRKTFTILNKKNSKEASLKFEQTSNGYQFIIIIPLLYIYPH